MFKNLVTCVFATMQVEGLSKRFFIYFPSEWISMLYELHNPTYLIIQSIVKALNFEATRIKGGFLETCTARPRDTRPRGARTLEIHGF